MKKILEATEIRKEVRKACCESGEDCRGCPFHYTCEIYFPEIDHREAPNDLLPIDYVLTKDGKYFEGEV